MFTIALNMEFCRSADKSFEQGVEIAAGLGYRHIEPMVHTGWELLSEVGYFHSFSMEEDPLLMRDICARYGVEVASLSGHSPLMKPEAAIPRLTRAIVLADALGARWVNTDEMLQAGHGSTTTGSLTRSCGTRSREPIRWRAGMASTSASSPAVFLQKTAAGLRRIVELVPSRADRRQLGHDQVEPGRRTGAVEALESVLQLVRHVHAKDISMEHAERERGVVTGDAGGAARAATASSTGSASWRILRDPDRDLVLSVECGTIDEAERGSSRTVPPK